MQFLLCIRLSPLFQKGMFQVPTQMSKEGEEWLKKTFAEMA